MHREQSVSPYEKEVQFMGNDQRSFGSCVFCGNAELLVIFEQTYHPFKTNYGPFDILICSSCGSSAITPIPTPIMLDEFYLNYELYRGKNYLESQRTGMLDLFYESCMKHLCRHINFKNTDRFRWIDIGAGNGQMAVRMAETYPNATGLAVDLAGEPSWHSNTIDYRSADINVEDFSNGLCEPADIVYSNFVIEHVLRPDIFLRNLISLTKPGGILCISAPDFGSISRRVFGRKWPALVPGEHLFIPARDGFARCAKNQADAISELRDTKIKVYPISISYSVRYLLNYFGMSLIAGAVPKKVSVPTPSVAMMLVLHRSEGGLLRTDVESH